MSARVVRAIPRRGRLDLLEPLDLPEGQPVQVTVESLAPVLPVAEREPLGTWNLGVKQPLTRDEIYADLI